MTKVVAVAMVKDEMDVLPYVIQHMFVEGIKDYVIADNLSTDGTLQFLAECEAPNFHLFMDDDPAYYQAAKMNGLVRKAVDIYGTDIVVLPFDADEMFYSIDPSLTLAESLQKIETMTEAIVYDHVPHPTDDRNELNPLRRMTHRMPHIKSPQSVAFRYHKDASLAMGNHQVSYPGTYYPLPSGLVAVRHFQYRSQEQYMRKLRNGKKAYDATDLDPGYGFHWRDGGAKSDEQLTNEWNAYMAQPSIYDPAPVKVKK